MYLSLSPLPSGPFERGGEIAVLAVGHRAGVVDSN